MPRGRLPSRSGRSTYLSWRRSKPRARHIPVAASRARSASSAPRVFMKSPSDARTSPSSSSAPTRKSKFSAFLRSLGMNLVTSPKLCCFTIAALARTRAASPGSGTTNPACRKKYAGTWETPLAGSPRSSCSSPREKVSGNAAGEYPRRTSSPIPISPARTSVSVPRSTILLLISSVPS